MMTIILPTDFSDNSWHAIEYAVKVYGPLSPNFILVHAYMEIPSTQDPMGTTYSPEVSDHAKTETKMMFHKIQNDLNLRNATLEWEMHFGSLAHIVSNVASERNADLIILGTKGASGLKELVLGSNANDVINATDIPVLAVPDKSRLLYPEKIVLATDYKYLETPHVLTSVKDLAKKFGSDILILNVLEHEKETISADEAEQGFVIHDVLQGVDHSYHTSYHPNIETGIRNFSEMHSADMIVMVKHNKSLFESLWPSSVTQQMAYHSEVPLMVLHDNSDLL